MAAFDNPPKAGVLAALRRHLARGGTFREAERLLKWPRSTLCDLAVKQNLPRRRRALSAGKKAQVKRLIGRGLGGWRVATAAGVSRATAWRYQNYFDDLRTALARSTTPRPCTPWRCPAGGELVKLTICIAHNVRRPARTAKRPRPRS